MTPDKPTAVGYLYRNTHHGDVFESTRCDHFWKVPGSETDHDYVQGEALIRLSDYERLQADYQRLQAGVDADLAEIERIGNEYNQVFRRMHEYKAKCAWLLNHLPTYEGKTMSDVLPIRYLSGRLIDGKVFLDIPVPTYFAELYEMAASTSPCDENKPTSADQIEVRVWPQEGSPYWCIAYRTLTPVANGQVTGGGWTVASTRIPPDLGIRHLPPTGE